MLVESHVEVICKELAKVREWQMIASGWLAAVKKEQDLYEIKKLNELNQEKQRNTLCVKCRELLQELKKYIIEIRFS